MPAGNVQRRRSEPIQRCAPPPLLCFRSFALFRHGCQGKNCATRGGGARAHRDASARSTPMHMPLRVARPKRRRGTREATSSCRRQCPPANADVINPSAIVSPPRNCSYVFRILHCTPSRSSSRRGTLAARIAPAGTSLVPGPLRKRRKKTSTAGGPQK